MPSKCGLTFWWDTIGQVTDLTGSSDTPLAPTNTFPTSLVLNLAPQTSPSSDWPAQGGNRKVKQLWFSQRRTNHSLAKQATSELISQIPYINELALKETGFIDKQFPKDPENTWESFPLTCTVNKLSGPHEWSKGFKETTRLTLGDIHVFHCVTFFIQPLKLF